MNGTRRVTLLACALALLAPRRIAAQKDLGSCKPVLDAYAKLHGVSNHIYSTTTAAYVGGKSRTAETITIGGVTWVLVNGSWRRSPITAQALAEQERENIANARASACHHVRDEVVDGVPAALYTTHEEDEDDTNDARVWIARSTGLPLRQEIDLDVGGADGRSHMSSRFVYANVRAPAGAP